MSSMRFRGLTVITGKYYQGKKIPLYLLFPPSLKHCLLFLSPAVSLGKRAFEQHLTSSLFAFPAATLPADMGDCGNDDFSPTTSPEDLLFVSATSFFNFKHKVLPWEESGFFRLCFSFKNGHLKASPNGAKHRWGTFILGRGAATTSRPHQPARGAPPTGEWRLRGEDVGEKCLPSFPPHYLSVSFKEQIK